MIKTLINGYSGKMGTVLSNEITKDNEMELVGGISKHCRECFSDFKLYDDIFKFKDAVDMVIDFSHPSSLDSLLKFGLINNVPLVIGTTGLSDENFKNIKEAAKKIPIFYSANMSLGINLLLSLAKKAASFLGDSFDIEIVEMHHNKKIDSPSGTAYMIANEINKSFNEPKKYVFNRHERAEKRQKNEIGIHSIRGGTIVREHSVLFLGEDEEVEIKHRALSKIVFAQGAIKAAKFIYKKSAGFYTMDDMLKNFTGREN